MPHYLEHLTRATPGIIEVWVGDLLLDGTDQTYGQLWLGKTLLDVGALTADDLPQYLTPVEHLSGYVAGLFTAYAEGRYHAIDRVFLRNQDDNVVAVFDCRRFLKKSA